MTPTEHLTAGLAAVWDCTTEEAEKRIATKRKRASRDASREDIPWTAARCNRLLRTITSRISILQRQSKLLIAPPAQKSSENGQRQAKEELLVATPPVSRKCGKLTAEDPDWVPGAKLNAPTRTYSAHTKTQTTVGSKKSDSGFSTPFVKRLLSSDNSSTPRRRPQDPFRYRGGDKTRRSLQLPVQLATSNEEAQKNLVTAFNSVLMTTSEPSSPTRTGARSLLHTCLRRVPDYIDLETEELHADNVATEDVTSSVYSDLENLGTNSTGGWSGLCHVVRAHCIQYVRTAIDDRLICDARIAELINICSRSGAIKEADSLLSSWLAQDRYGSSLKLPETHPALDILDELRLTHDASDLYLRHHCTLVQQKRVWISDVLRSSSLPLKDLIKALIRGSGQGTALEFLEIAVLEDHQAEGSSALPIFARLAHLLTAIALTQSSDAGLSSGLSLGSVIHRIASSIAQLEHAASDSMPIQGRSSALHPFLMASAVLQLGSLLVEAPYTSIHIPLATILQHQHAFAKFVCGITTQVHRFSDADEMEALSITTSGFLNPSIDCSSKNRDALSRLAFEIAFSYAEQTGVAVDHRFAENVAAGNQKRENVAETPRRRVQVSGFKWEEGLCEWVAATPFPQIASDKVLPDDVNDIPKRTFSVKQDEDQGHPSKATLTIPSSPDVIAKDSHHSPARADSLARSAPVSPAVLRERSSNVLPVKQLELKTGKPEKRASLAEAPARTKRESRASSFLSPVEGKQVHLKLEKQKKRAAILAQQPITAPEKPLKRSHSLTKASESGLQRQAPLEDTDELGIPTPARKKVKFAPSFASTRQSLRTSMPARVMYTDAMSDDELGL